MDNSSGHILIGDGSGRLSFVTEATATLGATTIQVGTGGGAIVDAPTVDGTESTVLAVNGTDAAGGTLLQNNTSLSATSVSLHIGGSGATPTSAIHMGSFDNNYLSANAGAIPATAHFYICGKENGSRDHPAIYQLSFSATGVLNNAIGTPLAGLVSASSEECSPLTEVENTTAGKEWIFFSIGDRANGANPIPAGACRTDGAGCIMSIDITGLSTVASWNTFAGTPGPVTAAVSLPANNGGAATSGIIVDNISASSQASSIYFSLTVNSASGTGNPGLPQCNGHNGVGCAVKLTQAALQ
jgi:hypothetical protein